MLSREEKMNKLKELKEYGYISNNAFNLAINNFDKINVMELYDYCKNRKIQIIPLNILKHQSNNSELLKIFGKSNTNDKKEREIFIDDILAQIPINTYKSKYKK